MRRTREVGMDWRAFTCAVLRHLEYFQAKWLPVRVKKMRQNKNRERRSDSIGTGKALVKVTAGLAMILSLQQARAESDIKGEGRIPIAFAGFAFTDSSNEAADQRQVHAYRLLRFKKDLETGLGQSGKYRVIPITCRTESCGASDAEAAELAKQAKEAGAQFLLIGGIQKMSSLILWMKADVVDVNSDKTVYDRLLSFRGDNDAAWDHAKDFLLRQLQELKG
jgi:hypothetical protein